MHHYALEVDEEVDNFGPFGFASASLNVESDGLSKFSEVTGLRHCVEVRTFGRSCLVEVHVGLTLLPGLVGHAPL